SPNEPGSYSRNGERGPADGAPGARPQRIAELRPAATPDPAMNSVALVKMGGCAPGRDAGAPGPSPGEPPPFREPQPGQPSQRHGGRLSTRAFPRTNPNLRGLDKIGGSVMGRRDIRSDPAPSVAHGIRMTGRRERESTGG